MEEIYDEPAYSANVLEMIRVAHEYCLFAEQAEEQSKQHFLRFFVRLSPLLYLKGTLLPDIQVEYPEANERYITQEQWEELFNHLRLKIQPDDEFWIMDYEFSDENEPVRASLAENFTDIYQDLKDFVLLYQKNSKDAKQNAVHECKLLFSTRWGPKVLDSLRYVNFLLNKDQFTQEMEDVFGE